MGVDESCLIMYIILICIDVKEGEGGFIGPLINREVFKVLPNTILPG